jgi:hypothetical protein
LGKLIAELAIEENKQLFIATHDAEFIRGIMSTSLDKIKMFKLANEDSKFSYSTIMGNEISKIINNKTPSVINERILNSLFYNKTILCESENDRVFYEEATAVYHWRKFHDVNFIGFNGHHDAVKIYSRLNDLRINVAIILDIDYLKNGKLPNILDLLPIKAKFDSLQSDLQTDIMKSDEEGFKKKGISYLRSRKFNTLRTKLTSVISELKKHQIYIVPIGELESWVKVNKNDLNRSISEIRKRKIAGLDRFLKSVIQ